MPYPKKTATARICETLKAGGLPMRRTTGSAAYTRKWRSDKGWYNPKGAKHVH